MKGLLILLISLSQLVYSQNQFGIKVDVGASTITNNIADYLDVDFEVLYAPSFNAGFFYNASISQHWLVLFEAKYSHIHSREVWKDVAFIDINDNTWSQSSIFIRKRISYLSLPISLAFKVSKLTVSTGFQFSSSLGDNARVESDERIFEDYDENMILKQFDYGPKFGLIYSFSERAAIEASYYHGLNNLVDYDTGDFDIKYKVRQITLGFRYAFFSKG
jgi:hypothetical protein